MIKYLLLYLAYVFIWILPLIIYKIRHGKDIKGNINRKGDKIYYTKEHRLYYTVDAEKYFRSEKAAEKAGFRKPKR